MATSFPTSCIIAKHIVAMTMIIIKIYRFVNSGMAAKEPSNTMCSIGNESLGHLSGEG